MVYLLCMQVLCVYTHVHIHFRWMDRYRKIDIKLKVLNEAQRYKKFEIQKWESQLRWKFSKEIPKSVAYHRVSSVAPWEQSTLCTDNCLYIILKQ